MISKRFAIVLSGVLVGAALWVPFRVNANPRPLAQLPPMMADELPFWDELNLTAEQETALTQLRQNTRTQLENVLSEEQRQQFRTTLEAGSSFREAAAAMNLSPEQHTELRSIVQSARQEAATILTPEQREQIHQRIQSWRRS